MESEEQALQPPRAARGSLLHVRIPVRDPWASRDWYTDVLDFVPLLDLEWESGIVGVVLRHEPGWFIGLHQDAVRARALEGFTLFGLTAAGEDALRRWEEHFTVTGVPHGPITEGHLGLFFDVADPDGILIRLHAGPELYAEEA